MTFSGVFFYFFDINILEYSQISDFVIVAFKDPFYILFFLLTILFILLLYLFDKWLLKTFPKIWLFLKKKRFLFRHNANTLLLSYAIVLMGYTIQTAVFYGEKKAKAIKEGKGVHVKVYLTTGAEPMLHDSLPSLIGTTSSFVFLYDHQKKTTEIIPFNSVRKIIIQDKKDEYNKPKTVSPPTRKP